MLSSTAKNLYWLGRYLQRAKSTARLLEASQRTALLSASADAGGVAAMYGLRDAFAARHPGGGMAALIDFMTLDADNGSSLFATVRAARANARTERNNLTTDVWESLNGLWLEIAQAARAPRGGVERGGLIDTIKRQTVMIVGAIQTTLLRDDAYNFVMLGIYLERADNTARVLDVKFHELRPDGDPVAGPVDYYRWSEILDCVGAVRTYRRIYRSQLDPLKVAELMILRRDLPRSIHHCLWQVDLSMGELADIYGARGEANRLAGALHARLRYARIEDVFETGLGPWIEDLGTSMAALSDEIGRQFLLD